MLNDCAKRIGRGSDTIQSILSLKNPFVHAFFGTNRTKKNMLNYSKYMKLNTKL